MSSPLTAASPPFALISATTSSAGCSSGRRAGQPGTDVVDDDPGALLGQQERLLAPDAPSGSGDDGHLAVEQSHVLPLSRRWLTGAHACRAARRSSVADRGTLRGKTGRSGAKPGQSLAGDFGRSARRSRPGPGPPEALGQADDLEPAGGAASERPVGAADDAQDRQRAPSARARARSSTPPGTLPWKEGGSRWPSPVTTRSARSDAAGQPDHARHQVEARLDPGAQGQPGRRPGPRRPRRRARCHIDADLAPVAVRHRGEARASVSTCAAVAPFWGPKIRAASRKGVVTSQATTSSTPPRASGRAHRLEGPPAAVGGGGAAAADHDAARAGVPGGQQELADPGGAGADRVVPAGPGQQGAAGGTGHLDDGGGALAAVRPSSRRHSASTGSPSGPATTVARRAPPSASNRPSPPSDIGTSSALQPAAAGRPDAAAATSAADDVPRNLSGAATRCGMRRS